MAAASEISISVRGATVNSSGVKGGEGTGEEKEGGNAGGRVRAESIGRRGGEMRSKVTYIK